MVDFYGKLVGKYNNHPIGIHNVRWTGMTSPISIGGPDQVVPEPSEEAEHGVPWGKSEIDMALLGGCREWGMGVRCIFCWWNCSFGWIRKFEGS